MTDNIQKKAITIKKTVLSFTDSAIPHAWENYDPAQIEEQPDGSLLVTIHDAVEFKIINIVLNGGGEVQVVSPPELAEKVVEQAERVIRANRPQQSAYAYSAYPAYPAYSRNLSRAFRPGVSARSADSLCRGWLSSPDPQRTAIRSFDLHGTAEPAQDWRQSHLR